MWQLMEQENKKNINSEGPAPRNAIVIGRQAGSCGRKVGKAIASLLGVEYYDRELLRECAEQFGYSPAIFEMADERRPPLFRSLLAGHIGLNDSSPMNGEKIYTAQSEVIRGIAERGSAVFVGRTADYVLREHPGLFSVFLHAPEEWRARNIMERGESKSLPEALTLLHKLDNRRQDYYNYFTPGGWGKAANYDICIDSSRFDAETLAHIIIDLATKASANKKRH